MNADQGGTPADPTVANELRELDALTNKAPTPDAPGLAAATDAINERRAARVLNYAEKVTPFVQAYGARLRMPLSEIEVEQMSHALGDVGAEIIPESAPDNEPHPWQNLLGVALMISVPRLLANLMQRNKPAPKPADAPGQDTPPAPERVATPGTPHPISAVEMARQWET